MDDWDSNNRVDVLTLINLRSIYKLMKLFTDREDLQKSIDKIKHQ